MTDAPSSRWTTPENLLRISVVVAIATIAFKTVAWAVSGSVGLLSDALESLVNLVGALFALGMVTIAKRPADDDHPYGHTKAEYFSAGFEGLLIFGAAMAILWASVDRLLHPQPLEQLGWGLVLSLISTALNGGLAMVMLRAARQHRSAALEGDGRHWYAVIVSPEFEGKRPIARHQRVYATLGDKMARDEVHALSMKTFTPAEWAAAQQG